ncbi:hypothetical protein BROUX41_006339 [Berkeleyomyces rouxiae]|uniref:uncharacterized protein n=1 Tax=Berkeleyomyces rouxiae TaxID=2035830 RepID=UPI003B7FEB12
MASVVRPLLRPLRRFALPCARPAMLLARPAFVPLSRSPAASLPVRYSSSKPTPSAHPSPASPDDASSLPASSEPSEVLQRKLQEPHYQLTFTCVPCDHRSTHIISKQGYHHGSVLIACPNCTNRHVISDHLNVFGDRSVTVEQLMKEKGEKVRKGVLDANGDVEFIGEEGS